MDWRIPDSRSRTPHRRIKNAPIQLKRSPPPTGKNGLAHSRFSLANAAPENQECAHPAEKVPPPTGKNGLAHSRFSLANAAPENQECAHPAEKVPPPTGKNGLAHSRFSLANAAPENQECAHPAEKVPPPQEKMDWRIPDSRSRTPHRRIKNAPIQLKRSPPQEKWIGAFPILARERRTGESRMRPSS